MARLPLIINGLRLKTLEGLRENFNLTELLERFRGGQLRAWLNCWDFDSEQKLVEALSTDLSEQELLEALCHIFGVEGVAKEQALTAFKEEQEKREEEAKRRKEQQEKEERAKTSAAKPLTLDESKLAVGTLKIGHKDNTSSTPTHSSNTSTGNRDLHYNLELNAEEAKSGMIKEVTITHSEICSLCSGSGRESGSGERNCTNCNGCGLVQGSKSIKVRIPADVKSGAKLRVQGQGNAGRGEAQPGDLYVHITVRKEPSVSPSQTNSTDHTTPLKEIADAMNPLKNPSVLISPPAGVTKAVINIFKNKW
jgi:DnaJ-class molecular chaperone